MNLFISLRENPKGKTHTVLFFILPLLIYNTFGSLPFVDNIFSLCINFLMKLLVIFLPI